MKDTIRLNFDFPRGEYPYLKLMCAERGISFRELATELLFEALEEYEDRKLGRRARKRLKELNPKDNIPFDEAIKEAGWKGRA
jgi:hypothetical protein